MKNQKHNNRITYYDGHRFHSNHECDCYKDFKLLFEKGKISDLKLQVPYVLIPAVYHSINDGTFIFSPINKENWKKPKGYFCLHPDYRYYADFVVTYPDGSVVVYDAKGYKTDVYKRKKKMMLKVHGIEIKEI